MIIIPLTNAGARSIDVDIGGDLGVFTFRSYWNGKTSSWNLDILDSNDAPVILGLPMVVGIDILKAHPSVSRRMGQLRVFSKTNTNNRTTEDMGVNAFLVHFEPDEFESTFTFPAFLPALVVDIEDVTQ